MPRSPSVATSKRAKGVGRTWPADVITRTAPAFSVTKIRPEPSGARSIATGWASPVARRVSVKPAGTVNSRRDSSGSTLRRIVFLPGFLRKTRESGASADGECPVAGGVVVGFVRLGDRARRVEARDQSVRAGGQSCRRGQAQLQQLRAAGLEFHGARQR